MAFSRLSGHEAAGRRLSVLSSHFSNSTTLDQVPSITSSSTSATSLPLADKLALVTGASRGIGACIARRLAKDGAIVIVHYANSKEKAEEVAKDIIQNGGRAEIVGADLSTLDGPYKLISQLDSLFGGAYAGRLDILVNNSGMAVGGLLTNAKVSDFDKVFNLNVRSMFILSQEAARRSISRGWGRIINIGSSLGESVPVPGISLYSGTKFAVRGMTRGWSRDLGASGVTVNNVEPGAIDTDMNPANGPLAKKVKQSASLARHGTTEEVASLVAWIASPASSYLHGASIPIDGGWSA